MADSLPVKSSAPPENRERLEKIGALTEQFYKTLPVMRRAMIEAYLPADLRELLKQGQAS